MDTGGALAAGTRVGTDLGTVTSDGSSDYTINAATESPNLDGRRRLHPPSEDMPQLVYLGDEAGESELMQALKAGDIDPLARGEVGNRDAANASGGTLGIL